MLITLHPLPVEKRVICQKFRNVVETKMSKLHSRSVKYSLSNLIGLSDVTVLLINIFSFFLSVLKVIKIFF